MNGPALLEVVQIQTELIPVVFTFTTSVNGVNFNLVHDEWGTIAIVGDGTTVSIDVDSARAATDVGRYGYRLVANPGIAGGEHIVVYGPWIVRAVPDV